MASVYVTTTARNSKWSPYSRCNYERVIRAAHNDSVGVHKLSDTPSAADIILFVESESHFHFDILKSDICRNFTNKCFVFESQDCSIPLLPGLYLDIPPHLKKSQIYQYGFYIRIFDNDRLATTIPHEECRYLFSFIGSRDNCAEVRDRVLALKHPRAYLANASSGQSDTDEDYATVLQHSKFVICPRGFSASTWRCFEAMRSARVPVIVSDNWFPPSGLDWSQFSVQVRQSDVSKIPYLLESLESEAEKMGLKGQQAWNDNFSLNHSFHWIVERCLEIQPKLADNRKLLLRHRLFEVPGDRRLRFLTDYVRNILLPVEVHS